MTTMTKKPCTITREELTLYYYDELGAAARADVERRLAASPACQEELASLSALEAQVPRTPSVQIEDDVLAAIRTSTSRRLQEEASRPAPRILSLTWPSLPRLAMGMAAVVAIFFVGRITAPGESVSTLASGLPEADTRISDIQLDRETGFVQISWEETRPVSIQADLSDQRVQALLSRALQDESNPGSRLQAVRAVSQVELFTSEPDPALTLAMEEVLRTESNEGIRLQTLKALSALHQGTPVSESLKGILIEMLTSERSPAIRIEVLNLLTRNELTSMELQTALQEARQDANPFIRSQAEAALADMESTTPLESIE